jgi:hypothetical protein
MHLVLAEKNNTPNAVQKLEQAKPADSSFFFIYGIQSSGVDVTKFGTSKKWPNSFL